MSLNYALILHHCFSNKQTDKTGSIVLKIIIQNPLSPLFMKTLVLETDSLLIQQFRNGNDKALEVLIWRYKEKIFSSILFLVKDKYLAEDLFQDTFIKIIDTLRNDQYSEEGKFLSYAIRVAHNICVDHFRKVKRVQFVHTGDNNDFFEIFNAAEGSTDKGII